MERRDVRELHYIVPIANLPSIQQLGILSHKRVQPIRHVSVAMQEIQDKRARIRVPGGRPLHEYANLYLHARNPMMYKRRHNDRELCVLRIASTVLELPNVVLTDGNASSNFTAFYPSPEGLRQLNSEHVFARYWSSDDVFEAWEGSRLRCAEVLVPNLVDLKFITGVYASGPDGQRSIQATGIPWPVALNPDLFFKRP